MNSTQSNYEHILGTLLQRVYHLRWKAKEKEVSQIQSPNFTNNPLKLQLYLKNQTEITVLQMKNMRGKERESTQSRQHSVWSLRGSNGFSFVGICFDQL